MSNTNPVGPGPNLRITDSPAAERRAARVLRALGVAFVFFGGLIVVSSFTTGELGRALSGCALLLAGTAVLVTSYRRGIRRS